MSPFTEPDYWTGLCMYTGLNFFSFCGQVFVFIFTKKPVHMYSFKLTSIAIIAIATMDDYNDNSCLLL